MTPADARRIRLQLAMIRPRRVPTTRRNQLLAALLIALATWGGVIRFG